MTTCALAQQLEPVLGDATRLLKALSHPARLMICCQLRDGEMSVGTIEKTLDIRQPILSRELAKLREAKLVTTRRESRVVFYRLASEEASRMIEAVCGAILNTQTDGAPQGTGPGAAKSGSYGVFARPLSPEDGVPHEKA